MRELARESDRMVDFFARHGIEHEARVALLLLDQIEFPIIFWGALKAGVQPGRAQHAARDRRLSRHPRATAAPARCSSRTSCCPSSRRC